MVCYTVSKYCLFQESKVHSASTPTCCVKSSLKGLYFTVPSSWRLYLNFQRTYCIAPYFGIHLITVLGNPGNHQILEVNKQRSPDLPLTSTHLWAAHEICADQLAQRWWNELFYGTHMYDRQEQEVAMLRLLQPVDLLEFAVEKLLQPATRRKVTVQVRGSAEALAASSDIAAAAAPPPIIQELAGSVAGDTKETADQLVVTKLDPAVDVLVEGCHSVENIMTWKRGCEMWPNVAALSQLSAPR